MEVILQKWGNSDGIRIPSNILKLLKLKINDVLDLMVEDDKIIILKSKREKVSLESRFKKYNDENLTQDFVWDELQGKEIW